MYQALVIKYSPQPKKTVQKVQHLTQAKEESKCESEKMKIIYKNKMKSSFHHDPGSDTQQKVSGGVGCQVLELKIRSRL